MARRQLIRDQGTSILFVANTNKVDLGTDFLGSGNVSFGGWINVQGNGSGNSRILDNGKIVFHIETTASQTLRLRSDGSTNAIGGIIPRNTWTHVFATRTSSGVANLYINGILSGSANQSSGTPATATTNLTLGKDASGTNNLVGQMDEFKLFSRILTSDEISEIYYSGNAPFDRTITMLGEYNFDDAATNSLVILDSSGNLRNGTRSGGSFVRALQRGRAFVYTNLVPNSNFGVGSGTTSTTGTYAGNSGILSAWMNSVSGGGVVSTTYVHNDDPLSNSAKMMELKAITNSGAQEVRISLIDGSSPSAIQQDTYLIPIKPSTQYTFSYRVKYSGITNTGGGTGGFRFAIIQYNGIASGAIVTDSLGPDGTTNLARGSSGWITATKNITTNVAGKFLQLRTQFIGELGTVNISNVSLFETNPSLRQTATDRFLVRDFGTALVFNGTDSHVDIPHNANQFLTNGFTFSAWINPRGPGEGNTGQIIDKSTGALGANGFRWSTNVTGAANPETARIVATVNGGTSRFSANGAIKFGVWQHVLVTVTSTAVVQNYVNGVATGTPGTTGALSGITTTNVLTLGNRSGVTSGTFDGVMDNVRIFNRPFTAIEISNMSLYGTYPADALIGDYQFNEGSGTSTLDSSGGGHTGTITGATYTTDVFMKARQSI